MDCRITPEVVDALAGMPELALTPRGANEDYYNPPHDVYKHFNFLDLHGAYSDAALFLNYLLSKMNASPKRLLDFGCGWGRMLRLLSKSDCLTSELCGCDIDKQGVEFIRRTVPGAKLAHHSTPPPLPYPDANFDFIYAFSVFSHLPAKVHLVWAQELRRISEPGATVCVTTQGLKFLKWFAKNPDEALPRRLPLFTTNEAVERYEAGEFLYECDTPNMPDYGHAVVPRSFFEEHWQPLGFEIIDWDESRSQVRCLMKVE